MHFHSHLNSAVQILTAYGGEEPFASFLKKYFSANKKHGSKDRKYISHLCYCFFRLGKSLPDLPMEEKIVVALFLCSEKPNDFLKNLKPEWNEKADASIGEKLSILNYPLLIKEIFPWKDELGDNIDHKKISESFLTQPDLFLRLRPGREKIVLLKLKNAGIKFNQTNHSCVALPNATKIENVIELNKEAVVQDQSSQRISEFIEILKPETINHQLKIWDCCAASGGKSILVKDILSDIDLVVSDLRQSILINFKKRFEEAGIANYKSFITDLSLSSPVIPHSPFELIIADVPCTGSGTWGRTPEQLYFFNSREIERYSQLQKKIISNIIPHLLPGGYLSYITCSVFKKENEDIIEFIRQQTNLEIIKMENLIGYERKADTMFAALLRKPL
ncbi:MAG: Fmu (Sun) domain-containing protein [Chitinophagaceae bacterium]